MKILIAEDGAVSRCFLEATLVKWGFEVVVATEGNQALALLEADDAPPIAILDWTMPEVDGIEICRRLRARRSSNPIYTLILTARSDKEDVIAGFEAGADDYIIKPFNRQELRARLNIGVRIVELQRSLAAREKELEVALQKV